MSYPQLITLGLSTKCNQDCIFCSSCGIRKDTDLDMFGYITELIQPTSTIDITGQGEILLHPQFREMTQLITERGADCSFATNGSPLSKDVVHYLDSIALKVMNVSVNSLHAETHQKLTKRPFLPLVLSNLEYLFARPRNYRVSLSMVATAYNWHEMPSLVQYAIAHKANSVRLLALAPSIEYDRDLLVPDTPLVRECLEKSRALANAARLQIVAFSMDPQKKGYSSKCKAPWIQFRIDLDGSVKTCCWSNRTLGNIKQQSWKEIWDGPLWQEFRESVRSGAMTYCQQCREFG